MRNLFQYIGLRYLRVKPVRSALTTLGVSLGVALYVAIQIINHSTLDSFKESIESISGKAALSVTAGEAGFSEKDAEVVAKIPGVAHAVPMVETRAFFAGERSKENLSILGVDLLKEQSVRTYKTTDEQVIDDPLIFLNQPDSVIVTHVFAKEHGLKIDSPFEIATSSGKKKLIVRGLLSPEGAAKAYGGALAIMDIDGAQATFGKVGRLDRLDIVPKPGIEVENLTAKIKEALGPGFLVEKPSSQLAGKENLVKSYQAMLSFFSTLALMVGLFFVTNSIAISVAERRREIGVLRALGSNRRRILLLFLSEGFAIGVVGSGIGVGVGRVLSSFLIDMVNKSISIQYMTTINATHLVFGPAEIAQGFLVGVGAAVVAAAWPSFKATTIQPLEAMKRHEIVQQKGPGGLFGITTWLGLCSLVYLNLSSLFFWGTHSRVHELLTQVFGIVGPALVGPGVVALLIIFLRRFSVGKSGPVTRLAHDNLLQNPKRTGSNVMTLMVGLIMVIILATVNISFQNSVRSWLDQALRADVLVSSNGSLISYQVQPIQEEIGRRIEKVSGVKMGPTQGAYGVRFIHILYQGKQLGMKAWDETDPSTGYKEFAMVDRASSEAGRDLFHSPQPSVFISENLSLHFKKKTGDSIEVPTPSGMITFKIVGIMVDFASPEGVLYIDRGTYKKFWHDPLVDAFGIVADKNTTPEQLRKNLEASFKPEENLMTISNAEMKADISKGIDEGFKYTRAIEGASLLVALLSLLNTFLISVMERTRELGMLRAMGMSRKQVAGLIIQEALVQGGFGAVVAVVLGAWIAKLWIEGSMAHTLGWILHFSFPWSALASTVGLGILVTLVAGFYPAWRAAHFEIREALEYE